MEGSIAGDYLPGAASLIDQLDAMVVIVLRDGRHLVGVLRSFDQYMNLILEDSCERIFYEGKYCDVPLGLFIVKGDSIVLLGEVDPQSDQTVGLEKITTEQLAELMSKQSSSPNKIGWDFD
eukprot:gene4892-6851_t